MTVRVIGPRDPRDLSAVNVTSQSAEKWSRGLSPFYLGPVPLYEGAACSRAENVENAWQFAKVYPAHADSEGNPTPAYFEWAASGWGDSRAQRYPMGKGAVPLYSLWAGERLPYLEARRRVYVPLYGHAVVESPAFARLLALYRASETITLWDFDGYDHRALGMTLQEVARCQTRKMGHAFILAHLLERMR